MAHAYTPGLQVTDRTRYRARRVLPIAGEVLVTVGDTVQARDVVARTELPGDITPINLALCTSYQMDAAFSEWMNPVARLNGIEPAESSLVPR